jgi:hypothetical protein
MASSRPAVTLRLTTQLRDKIIRSGYTTVGDLCAIPTAEFAKGNVYTYTPWYTASGGTLRLLRKGFLTIDETFYLMRQ